MGVHGLWQLLQPTGRPVTLESLDGKVLAVDVSIWLHHLVKGMRDRHGNSVPNAHLIGLFRRICKLLHYRIKPVFVFDGGVPELKKQTMARRRERKEEGNLNSSKAAKKMLESMLKHHAVSTVLGTTPAANHTQGDAGGSEDSIAAMLPLPATGNKGPDMFQLPALPETDQPSEPGVYDDSWEERLALKADVYTEFADLENIDIESEDFKCLPPEMQHEILTDIRDARKYNSWSKPDQLPQVSDDFSSYQLRKLVKQNRLTQQIVDVRNTMNLQDSGAMAMTLTPAQREFGQIETSRIVSEDASHYILIRGLRGVREEGVCDSVQAAEAVSDIFKQKRQENEMERDDRVKQRIEDGRIEDEMMTAVDVTSNHGDVNHIDLTDDLEIKLRNDKTDKIAHLGQEKLPHLASSSVGIDLTKGDDLKNSQIVAVDSGEDSHDDVVTPKEKIPQNAYRKRPSEYVNLSSDDEEHCTEDDLVRKQTGTINENIDTSTLNEKCDIDYSSQGGGFIPEDEDGEMDEQMKITDGSPLRCQTNQGEELPINIDEDSVNDVDLTEGSITNVELGKRPGITIEESQEQSKRMKIATDQQTSLVHLNRETGELSEDDGDFLEITIDPQAISPDDELFPASVFTQDLGGGEEARKKSRSPEPPHEDSIVIDDDENNVEDQERDEVHLHNEFEGMSQSELFELQEVLVQQTAELQEMRQKQDRVGATITDQMYIEAQELLELFGLPYVISPMEAEAQCAQLDLTNQTAGSITDDSDIWLFGGKRVYKNFFNQNKHVEFYKEQDIQTQMLLTRRKMIDIGLLCGSDYTDGIQGVGPVTAMEILGEFQGLELTPLQSFREWWDTAQEQVKVTQYTKVKNKLRQLHISPGFPSDTVVDAYLNPTVDQSEEPFSWGKPDLDLLRDYSSSKFGWVKAKSDELLLPMMKQFNQKQTQLNITSFMISEPQESRKLKSKRVKRILNRMRSDIREGKTTDTSGAGTRAETINKPKNSVASKGKATRGRKPKNSVRKGRSNVGEMAVTSGGGFVPLGISRAPPSEQEVVLSESSADSDVGFGGSDSDDALLASIDLDEIQRTEDISAKSVVTGRGRTRGQGHKRGQVRVKGQDKTMPDGIDGDSGPLHSHDNTSNESSVNDNISKNINTPAAEQSSQGRQNIGKKSSRGRGKGKSKQTKSHFERNFTDIPAEKPGLGLPVISDSQYFGKTAKVVRRKVLSGRESRGKKTQKTVRTVADVKLSESDSESE